ncbi:discoidin domain-containing protein [Peribacillus sp. NPDC097264]|uniref:galactose-binding domain-containing protein n=1 Tax=unclassified Peribacillus TaxID=2675266 RepID=UPI003830B6EF
MIHKWFISLLAIVIVAGGIGAGNIKTIYANGMDVEDQQVGDTNLALNKSVEVSKDVSGTYNHLKPANLVDGVENSRWGTEANPTQWAIVDLGKTLSFNEFRLVWESAQINAKEYNILVSDDKTSWQNVYSFANENGSGHIQTVNIEDTVRARYVKIEIKRTHGYPTVSMAEFGIYLQKGIQEPTRNVAFNQKVTASGTENAASVVAPNAVDNNDKTRWASDPVQGKKWFEIDLGKERDIKTVVLNWERRNATDYKIQISSTGGAEAEDWQNIATFASHPKLNKQKIVLDKTYKSRYIRLYVDEFEDVDQVSGGVSWSSVSLYEFEVYGGEIKNTVYDVVGLIPVPEITGDTTKLPELDIEVPEGFNVQYNGTDYEQVIGEDGTIYKPLVDTDVLVSYKVTEPKTGEYTFAEMPVTVPGRFKETDTDNARPVVIPELREWKGSTGNFKFSNSSKIVVKNKSLMTMAKTFAADYKDQTGKKINVVVGGKAKAGDFYFETIDAGTGLKDEGYKIDIADKVSVQAENPAAAFWATRTILQILKQNDNITIPKGTLRDYPKYKVRGFVLDVGRKTFTMDYLQQIMKEMSWYKLNDFQIHLNDNFIFLEEYTKQGLDPLTAYTGFRLESDIKKGGNNGLNKADLTSKDLFYTKAEFKKFIKDSRVYGVNIVPEIDTPAHSLSLTNVRPDLRLGTNGRQNDHLDIAKQYDASLEFVQSIFAEYMEGKDPVFDEQTIVHVGADEFSADKEAFRRFSNDMMDSVSKTGRQARIWGSFSSMNGNTPVKGEGVQINLWNAGWAKMDEMYESGFDLINTNDGHLYMVPNAGYYYDYLNNSFLYNDWEPNNIASNTIPAGDKQMIGAAFAVWNDAIDQYSNGTSEYDVYDRIQSALPYFASKVWGKGSLNQNQFTSKVKEIDEAPNTDLRYKVDSKTDTLAQYNLKNKRDTSGNGYDLGKTVKSSLKKVDGRTALQLKGNESYIKTPLTKIGVDSSLRFKVKRTATSHDEQILFESDTGSLKAVQRETGKVGFSREGYDYSFDYTLPVGEWVELEIATKLKETSLYVNGKLVDVLGDNEKVEATGRPYTATFILPFERIGSKKNSFQGYVSDVELSKVLKQ